MEYEDGGGVFKDTFTHAHTHCTCATCAMLTDAGSEPENNPDMDFHGL